jgi:hypothetical protein
MSFREQATANAIMPAHFIVIELYGFVDVLISRVIVPIWLEIVSRNATSMTTNDNATLTAATISKKVLRLADGKIETVHPAITILNTANRASRTITLHA